MGLRREHGGEQERVEPEMETSLKKKTLHALSWSFLDSAGLQCLRFLIGVTLARLLAPEQFGLIGMLLVVVAITQSFIDGGFGAALVQKREITASDTCSVFYFNMLIGVAAAGAICIAAPWIAAFYRQPDLVPFTRVLSLVIVAHSLGLVQTILLTRQTDFKTQAKVNFLSTSVSGMLGIGFAVGGFGVWSLVIQQVSSATLRTIGLWLFTSWRPALHFSLAALRRMFAFGSRMLCSNLLNQFFDNIYLIVIGRLFPPVDLGYFTRAMSLQELPSATLSVVVGRVAFPVLASIQDDRPRIKLALKKALKTLVLVNFPLMIGLAVVARPLVLIVLTEKWAPSIPYLQLLCLVGLLLPLHIINLSLLTAVGRSDLFLRLEIIKKALVAVSILVTWRWGITAMIYGMIAVSVVGYYVNSFYSGTIAGYPVWEQLRDLCPYLVIATLMGLVAYAAGVLVSTPGLMLVLQVTVGALTYVALCRAFRLAAFVEMWVEIRHRLPFARVAAAG